MRIGIDPGMRYERDREEGKHGGEERGFLRYSFSRHRVRVLFLLAAISTGVLLPGLTENRPGEDPHAHFRKPEFCARCHLIVGGKPDQDRFLPEADQFCLGCHRVEELGRSHPRNVRPADKRWKMKIPEEYRLDDGGGIICLTCHKGHGEFLSPVRAFPAQKPERTGSAPGDGAMYRTFYARRSDPEKGFAVLCNGCHLYL